MLSNHFESQDCLCKLHLSSALRATKVCLFWFVGNSGSFFSTAASSRCIRKPPAAATSGPGPVGEARRSEARREGMRSRTTASYRGSLEQSRVASVAETVEGRRSVEGRVRRYACPGHRAGIGMSPKLRAHGSELHGPPKPRWPITSDLRQEPGALAAHAGICAGGVG